MHILIAGAKEETKSEPFSDPRVAVHGEEIDLMVTYFEFQGKLKPAKKKFLKSLRRKKREGKPRKVNHRS